MGKNMFLGKKQVKRKGDKKYSDSKDYKIKELHNLFIIAKRAEGLRERTIKDHKRHFRYLTTWMAENIGSDDVVITDLDIQILRQYIDYMQNELQVSPVTVNVRLRTLRAFLRFIFEEGYYLENLAIRIKLMKIDKDTLKIMSDTHINAILHVIDKKSYTGYRIIRLLCFYWTQESVLVKLLH
ncbi:tyrosine-type recombinase/integrase [Tepidibacillus infernus]|uniref:tyrosine-type recombinase/integrase n=1 Tax=Tepidibacillus infernus TaxID=1806172 RepID=UPI003B719E20